MTHWFLIAIPALLFGMCMAALRMKRGGVAVAVIVPVLAVFAMVFYTAHADFHRGTGSPLWPVALLFTGIVAGFSGWGGWALGYRLISRRNKPE